MTIAQYDALLEVLSNGDKFKAYDLNIPKRTVASIAKKGWVSVTKSGRAFVTEEGFAALAS